MSDGVNEGREVYSVVQSWGRPFLARLVGHGKPRSDQAAQVSDSVTAVATVFTTLDDVGYVRIGDFLLIPARWPTSLGPAPAVGETVLVALPSNDPCSRDARVAICQSREGVTHD